VLICGAAGSVRAQDLIQQAQNEFFAGEYKKASDSAQEYLARTGDTKSALAAEANFYIAFFDCSRGNYEKALARFRPLAEAKAVATIRERGVFYLADCQLRFGDSLAWEADIGKIQRRKELYDAAEQGFKQYLAEFRDGLMRHDALLGLAKTCANLKRNTQALELLDRLVKTLTKPNPTPAELSLLVQAYNLKATISKNYREELLGQDKQADADKFLDDLKREIVAFFQTQTDPTVANEVAFALGDLFASLNQFRDAVEFYRRVKPKGEILAAQAAKIKQTTEERGREFRLCGGNVECRNRVAAYYAKWLAKMQDERKEMESRPDPLVTALQREVYCYLGMRRYDEAAILATHLMPFAKGESARSGLKLAVVSQIGSHQADDAAWLLQEFEKQFGAGDPDLDSAAFYIGQLYESRGDDARALQFYEKSARDYPQGRWAQPNLLRLAVMLVRAKRYEAALGKFDAYEKAIGEISDQYLYYRGKTLLALGRWGEAVEQLRALNERFASFPLCDDAIYSLAVALAQNREPGAAAEVLAAHLAEPRAQTSPHRPNLVYQLGLTYQAMPGKTAEAVAAFEEVAKLSDHPLAPFAQLEIARTYSTDRAKMEESLRKALELKNAPSAVRAEAYFLLGWMHQQEGKWDDAIAQYQQVVDEFPNERKAVEAQVNLAACAFAPAKNTRAPGTLPHDRRQQWEAAVARALKANETLLEKFPGSAYVEGALAFMSQIQALRIEEKLAAPEEVENYFRALANRFTISPTLQARVIYALGNAYSSLKTLAPAARDARALQWFDEAYRLSKDGLGTVETFSRYCSLLTQTNQFDRVIELARQLQNRKFAAARDEQLRLLEANWWLGHAYFLKRDYSRAAQHLQQLADAPWYAHYLEAQFDLASIAETKAATPESMQETLKQYAEITRKAGPAAVKARALLRAAYLQSKLAASASSAEAKELRAAARTAFLQLDMLYEREVETCAEALFQAGQLWELDGNKAKAVEAYQRAVARAPDSEWAQRAKARLLQELGAPQTSLK
jgi:TolA-binding protein